MDYNGCCDIAETKKNNCYNFSRHDSEFTSRQSISVQIQIVYIIYKGVNMRSIDSVN